MRTTVFIGITLGSLAFAAEDALRIPVPTPHLVETPRLEAKPAMKPSTPPAVDTWKFYPSVSVPVFEIFGLIDLFGSVERFRAAVSSDSVAVTRLKPRNKFALEPADYLEGESVALSVIEAEQLKRVLLLDSSYLWLPEETCECVPEYEFRVRFLATDVSITCDVSVSEKTLRVIDGNRKIAAVPFSPRAKVILSLFEGKRTKG